jgi:transposase InsO family protein
VLSKPRSPSLVVEILQQVNELPSYGYLCLGITASSQSNSMAESFVKTMKRDYVAHMPKPDRETALRNLAIAFEHYNEQHPHSALNYRSPREFRRLAAASI